MPDLAGPIGTRESAARGSDEHRYRALEGMAVAYWAECEPHARAVTSSRGNLTYEALNRRANQLVRALRARGLEVGDAVAIVCSNRPEFVETYAACLRGGFRCTAVNWHLTPAETAYILSDCEARALVVEAPMLDALRGVVRKDRWLEAVLVIGATEALGAGLADYSQSLAAEDGHDICDPTPGSTMLYTSGTTGRPKGVHRDRAELDITNISGYGSGDVHLCTGPLYHAAPLTLSMHAPLCQGVETVLMDKWDAEETLRLIEEHHVSHTHLVPTMFHRLLALPAETRERYDLSSLRLVVHGAAPCPESVKRRMIEWLGPKIVEYYAATEGPGTIVDSMTWLERPGTVGRPYPEGQVIVGDDEAGELARGDVGLVWLKAPDDNRFSYFKDAGKTAGSYRGDRFTLGDLGWMDEDGFLYLADRSADLIITGGVNVYPSEVDAVLLDHPAVADAVTIGVPSEEWGEEVRSLVEPADGITPTEELALELVDHCRARLASFKCPRRVELVEELPRQDNGKVYRRLLRDRYRGGDR